MPEPEILFSPLPEPEPEGLDLRDPRHPESVLFKLDQGLAQPNVVPIGGEQQAPEPSPPRTPEPVASEDSGVIDIRHLLEQRDAIAPPPSLVARPGDPPSSRHRPLTAIAPPRPRIPTRLLLGVVLTLLAAFALLAWKVQALL